MLGKVSIPFAALFTELATAPAITIDPPANIGAWKYTPKTCIGNCRRLRMEGTKKRLLVSLASASPVSMCYMTLRPLSPLPTTPQDVVLWGVESHVKSLEAAYGVVQVPLRVAVEFDAPYVACEHS